MSVEEAKNAAIRRHLALSTASNYAGQVINLGVWFVLTPFMIPRLGHTQYGLWVLVASFVAYGNLANLGIGSAVVKYVSEYRARGESETASSLIATALWIYCVLGLIVIAVALVIAPLIPDLIHVPANQRGTESLLVIICAVGVAVQLPASCAAAVLSGLGRFDVMNLIGSLAMLTLAGLLVGTLLLGGGVVWLAAMTIPVTVLWLAPTIWLIHRIAPDLRFGLRGAKRGEVRRVALFSSSLFGIQIAGVVKLQSDEVVIGASLNVGYITPYSVARRVSGLPTQLAYQFVQVILPTASRLDAEGDTGRLREVMLSGLRITTAGFVVIAGALIAFAAPFLRAWVGGSFASSADIVVLLTVAGLVQVMIAPVSASMQAMTRHRPLVTFALASAALNLALSIILVTQLGVKGVALGTLIATSLEVTVVIAYAGRVLALSPGRILGRALLPALGPAVPMMAVLFAIRYGLGPSTIIEIALSGIVGALVYLTVYFALPPTASERAMLRGILSRVGAIHRSRVDRHVPGKRGDTVQPRADRREPGEVEPALVRDVRVGVERDVGDGEAIGDEEGPA